jgi:hypothetical protein
MPRAHKVFEAAGIVASPFSVDFLSGADNTKIMDLAVCADLVLSP